MNYYYYLLSKSYNQILKAYRRARKQKIDEISGADEWILDNFYIIEEKTKELFQAIKTKHFSKLNKRILNIAGELLLAENCIVNIENIIKSFKGRFLFDSQIHLLLSVLEITLINKIAYLLGENKHENALHIGHCIISLKNISKIDMQKIIPEISEVEGILSREDYGNTYSNMTRQTKEFYRKRVEEIAKKQKSNPFAIAKQACLLAQKKKRHVGYFLITTELGKTHGNQKAFHRRLYAFFIVLPTTLLLAFCGLCYSWWLAALALIPISEIVINIVNYITTKFSKPSIIPKMDFSPKNGGIPDEFKTQVVIPAFISSIAEAENLLKNLEIFSYANNDKNIFFTLICDCKPELQNETKEKTIEKLWELNKKLGENKFSLFLREIAWERKRGALMEYAQSIRGKFKYIITLDSDTKLNREVAAALIGAMAHPLNTPKTSKWSKRVMHGYGMMQPRMITDVQSANKSLFSKIFAGQGGIDSYSFAVSDIYQDLFEEGIFAGKGIFDVEAFCKILPGVIKENSLLSHDLLEGSFLRCALLGDVSFVDDFPGNYKAYSKRNHRWTRGDWQLLPYLKCKLSAISKWKIIDNLRRSLLPICLTTLLIISPKLFPLVLLILCTQLLISTIEWASNQGYKTSGKRFHSTAIHGLRGVFLQTLFLFITLLHTAISNIDAIARTLWRVFVSHKNMLQWQTASQVESSQKNSIKSEFIFMWLSCVLALVLGILTANWLILLWIFAPLFTHKSGKIIPECKPNITDEDHHVLTHLAGRIWQYYEDFAIPKTNFLAPDNYQENPPNGIALRTSPTNIGMHILSAISAYDLGFIDLSKLISTLERILIAIAKLEKWHGNLYNWYDIETLKPLNPRYVSTVDSGNLLGYLMTAQAALEGIINSPPEGWQANTHCVKPDGVVSKLHSLLSKLQTLSDSMELRPLFDHSASLFSIGYDIEKQELTPTHYDILASEVRQTVYIAIARGEIPLESWAKMGRTLATHGGYRGLISWSGSMFEYLMPLLIMENVPNTLLNESYHFAIREQQRFAKTMVTPVWGVSESGFNKFDDNLNYQYKAFGVPALGVARSIQNDIVIAPYATCLALPIDYKSGIENIYRLNNLEFCGRYGFYEAVDYTPARLSKNENHAIVKQFMVHHLGMSLLSINNLLNDNILQKRFMSIPEIAAARELLCEKVPINVIISKETHHPDKLEKEFQQESDMVIREFSSNDALKYHVLSSHKSKTIIETSGKAFLNYDNLLLGSEERGSQIIINDVSFSENSSIIFAPPKAEFIQNRPDGLDITTTIFMANSFPAKLTKIFIANNSSEPREVNITMLTDIVLAKPDDHYAHPAFSKLFTKSKIIDDICLFERKGIHGAVYSVLTGGTALGIPHLETNRGIFRNSIQTLDPIAHYSFKTTIPQNQNATLLNIEAFISPTDDAISQIKNSCNENAFRTELELAYSRSGFESRHYKFEPHIQALALENLDFATKQFAQNKLWKYGISGDLPIFSHLALNIERAKDLINMHKFLLSKNLKTDLVFMLKPEGYEQPLLTELSNANHSHIKILTNLNDAEIKLIRRCSREV